MGEAAGLREPDLLLYVSIQIAVRTVLHLLHLVLAHLHDALGDAGELAGAGVEDDAIVEDPLAVGQHGLRAAVLLPPYVPLHALQIHGTGDIVLVGGKLQRINRLQERLDVGDTLHAGERVLEQGAKLVNGEQAHGARARLHVVGGHDEDALHADPVLGRAGLQL